MWSVIPTQGCPKSWKDSSDSEQASNPIIQITRNLSRPVCHSDARRNPIKLSLLNIKKIVNNLKTMLTIVGGPIVGITIILKT